MQNQKQYDIRQHHTVFFNSIFQETGFFIFFIFPESVCVDKTAEIDYTGSS